MEKPLIGLFGRNSAPPDLEDAVRRRIVGKTVNPEVSSVTQPAPGDQPSTSGEGAGLGDDPVQLLRSLAGALKRRGVEISTVRAGSGGFLVNGALGGASFQQWYSVHEVRQLRDVRGDERIIS